jgi:LacI family transcriptional regulator
MPKRQRRSNIRDVAAAANVSPSAVSLVIRSRPGVAEHTRERVWAVINELGYEVPAHVNAAKRQAVCLLIEKGAMPTVLDLFYGDIIRGFQTEAQRLGYEVLLHMYDSEADSPELLLSTLPDEARGLVIANDGDIRPETISELQTRELPIVLIENHLENHHVRSVLGDNFEAGYEVMRHMLDLRHRSIAILRGPRKYSSLVDRYRGCLAAIAEAGMLPPPEFLPKPVRGHPKKGYLQMKEILAGEKRPTAVVTVSDKTAFGALEAIREAGLSVPDDISLIGIDNVVESQYTDPPLTTYAIPRHEMGVVAMRNLHDLISTKLFATAKHVMYGELVIRSSTRAI